MWPRSEQELSIFIVWMTFSLNIISAVSLNDTVSQECLASRPLPQAIMKQAKIQHVTVCDSGKAVDVNNQQLMLQTLLGCAGESIKVEKPGTQTKDLVSFFVVISGSAGVQGTQGGSDASDSGGTVVASGEELSMKALALQTVKTYNLNQPMASLLIIVDPDKMQSAIWWSYSLNIRLHQEEVADLQKMAWDLRREHGSLAEAINHMIGACCNILKDNSAKPLGPKDIAWIAVVIFFSVVALYIVAKILYIRAHRPDLDEEEEGYETTEEGLEMEEPRPDRVCADNIYLGTNDIAAITTAPRSTNK